MRRGPWAGGAILAAGAGVWLLVARSGGGGPLPEKSGTEAGTQRPAPGLHGRTDGGRRAPGPPTPQAPSRTEAAFTDATKPQLRVWGRVVDESGIGVGGAQAELRAWSGPETDAAVATLTTVAGAGGDFEFTLAREGASGGFGIEAAAPGHVDAWRAVKLAEYKEARGIEVVAEAARSVAGRVMDAEGAPIPDATVQLWYGSENTWPMTADAEGRFRTPSKAPRRALELLVEVPGYPRRRVRVPAGAQDPTDVGDVAFGRPGRISGLVVDASGRPVGDLWLGLDHVDDGRTRGPRARTDGAGRFEFRDVGEAPVTVYADVLDAALGTQRRYRGSLTRVAPGRNDLRLEVRAQTSITLRFVDAGGRDPVNVRSASYGLRAAGTRGPDSFTQGTVAETLLSVTLSADSGGRYDVTVRAPGFDVAHVNDVDVGDVDTLEVSVPMRPKAK